MRKIYLLLSGLLILGAAVALSSCIAPAGSRARSDSSSEKSTEAPLTKSEVRRQLAEIQALIQDLDASVRSMNAQLASELAETQDQLSILKTKIEAQDRFLTAMSTQSARAVEARHGSRSRSAQAGSNPVVNRSGLPEPGAVIAQDGSGDQAYMTASGPTGGAIITPDPGASAQATGGELEPGDRYSAPDDQNARTLSDGNIDTGDDQPVIDDAKRLYDIAYQNLMNENYQLSLLNFRSFLDRYPAASLSGNAQYWIGEVYYAQRQFDVSIEQFRKVVEEYPGHAKVPAAYLKIALCFEEMQDLPTAKRYLNYLIGHYSDSREAELARDRLREW